MMANDAEVNTECGLFHQKQSAPYLVRAESSQTLLIPAPPASTVEPSLLDKVIQFRSPH